MKFEITCLGQPGKVVRNFLEILLAYACIVSMIPKTLYSVFLSTCFKGLCAPRQHSRWRNKFLQHFQVVFLSRIFSNHCKLHFSFTVWNLLQTIKILFSSCFYPLTHEFLSSTGNVLKGGLSKNIFKPLHLNTSFV